MNKKTMFLREFACSQCGAVMFFPKARPSGKGHIKTAYCPFCKMETDFELKDMDVFR